MQARRTRYALVAAICALPALASTQVAAQAPPPPPPALSADSNNNCGWGLGGAAALVGAAGWMAPGMGGAPANWGGLYFGGHLGCMLGETDWRFRGDGFTTTAGSTAGFDNSGLIAGGQIGYNW